MKIILLSTLILSFISCTSETLATIDNVDWSKYPKKPAQIFYRDLIEEFEKDNVVFAFQRHNLDLTIHTRDYKYYKCKAPLDWVLHMAEKYDPKGKKIRVRTE